MKSRAPHASVPESSLPLLHVLNTQPQAIICYDPALRKTWMNHAATAIDGTGTPGKAPVCLSHGRALDCGGSCPVLAAQQSRQIQSGDFVFADGRTRRIRAEPLLDAAGNLLGVVETIEDITALRRASRDHDETRRHLQAVLDSVNDAVFVIDSRAERIADVNAAAVRLFGFSRAELLQLSLRDLQAEGTADAAAPPTETSPLVWKGRAKDGRVFWAEVSTHHHGVHTDHLAVVTIRDVTEQKTAEDQLRASEATFHGLLDSLNEAICVLDPAGVVLEVNRAFEHDYGLTRDVILGRALEDFCDLDRTRLSALNEARQHALADQPQCLELWARRPDGFVFPKEASFTAGTFFGRRAVIGVLRDITLRKLVESERERAAVALRQSEERFRQLLGTVPTVAVQGYAPDGTVRYWNDASERLYGYTAVEALGRDIVELIVPPAARTAVRRLIQQMVESGQPMASGELELLRCDGSHIHALSSHAIVQTSLWGLELYCFDVDLTERKRAEAERLLAAELLRQSESRFRTLLEQVPTVAVQGYAPDGMVRYWNKASETLYGYTAAEALGRNLVDLIIPEPMRDEVRVAVRQMTETGVPLPAAELQLMRKDGSPVAVFSSHAVVQTAHAGPELYCLDFELTERKRAEEERLEMQRRLLHAQKLESLGVLAGGIAHDFNNLLTAILGNLDLALTELPPFGTLRPCVEDAAAAARHAADLTRQILAYSGHGLFTLRRVDLSEIVAENATILRAAVAKNVTFQLELTRPLPAVLVDPGQIHQVVLNLITNAAEAVGPAAGTVVLHTGTVFCDEQALRASRLEEKPTPGEFAFLEVTDSGSGMDSVTQQRMFEPFFTTKFAGRGLGMSAVLGILRAHHGAIFVDSRPGHGTAIRVLFPLARELEPAAPAPVAAPPVPDSPPLPLGGTLLLIDDEATVRTIGQRMGERLGLTVLVAPDGQEGLATFRWHASDIICVVVDLTMPVMNGIDCFELIHELRPDVPIILTSGYPREEVAERFRTTGFADFLQKPFTFQQLSAAVRRVSQRR